MDVYGVTMNRVNSFTFRKVVRWYMENVSFYVTIHLLLNTRKFGSRKRLNFFKEFIKCVRG